MLKASAMAATLTRKDSVSALAPMSSTRLKAWLGSVACVPRRNRLNGISAWVKSGHRAGRSHSFSNTAEATSARFSVRQAAVSRASSAP